MNTLSCRLGAASGGGRIFAWILFLTAMLSGMPRLVAQDVFVGEPVCLLPVPPPDELPHAQRRLRPDYPDDLRKTNQTGYVIITRYIDAMGTGLSMQAYGTHIPFQRAVEDEFALWKMTPARQKGSAVDAFIWVPVIFNPKSAGEKSAEATPRLLAVTPVITKERPTSPGQPPVVRMNLRLDAAGAIVQAEPEEAGVNPAVIATIRESLRAWRFAPARKAGVPVAAEISVPVICQPPPMTNPPKQVPPKSLKRTQPVYPVAMSRFGLHGVVKLTFVIDTDGAVRNPTVVRSDNPAFEEPAIEAILQWKFEPATREGKPVKTRAEQEVRFELPRVVAKDAFTITEKGDQSKLPPELRYDTPPRIRNVLVPVYPTELRRTNTTGHALVNLLVDTQGRVEKIRVVEADHPEFGLALAAAIEGFRFDPALKDGRPVLNLMSFRQDFNDRQLPDAKAEGLLATEKRHPERIVPATTLDAPLKPVSQRPPTFPVTASPEADQGSATIEFLVDEDGRARVPRIVTASEPAFGYAAMQAVAAWWFEPALKGGKPAIVRVQAPFEFSPPKRHPPEAGKN